MEVPFEEVALTDEEGEVAQASQPKTGTPVGSGGLGSAEEAGEGIASGEKALVCAWISRKAARAEWAGAAGGSLLHGRWSRQRRVLLHLVSRAIDRFRHQLPPCPLPKSY